ncbi:MAG TPA: hypothetical protein VF752_17035 [Thermoleophilaceae bacterium]
MGHEDATFTARVYRQVMKMHSGGLEGLERVIGCSRREGHFLLGGYDQDPFWTETGPKDAKKPSAEGLAVS